MFTSPNFIALVQEQDAGRYHSKHRNDCQERNIRAYGFSNCSLAHLKASEDLKVDYSIVIESKPMGADGLPPIKEIWVVI